MRLPIAALLAFILMALSFASPAHAPNTAKSQPAAAPETRTHPANFSASDFSTLMRRLASAWNSGDAQAAASCFTEDATYSGPPARGHHGRKDLYEYFGGARGRELPMRMTWHHLVFDPAQQIGTGEYTFRYRIQTHGIVLVKISGGLISNWREYEVESNLDWAQFTKDNPF